MTDKVAQEDRTMSHDAREAIEFLLWQYDRGGPLGDCKEAWEKLRVSLSPNMGLVEEVREDIVDLFNDAFNEHGPYGAGRDTPTQIAIGRVLDELKQALLAKLPKLTGEHKNA